MCVNIQWFVHRIHILTHTRFALSFLRTPFFSYPSCVCFLCSAVKGCLFVIGLPTRMSVRIDCDDAYSYGDNFIYLYSHFMIYKCDATTKPLTNVHSVWNFENSIPLDRHDAPFFSELVDGFCNL